MRRTVLGFAADLVAVQFGHHDVGRITSGASSGIRRKVPDPLLTARMSDPRQSAAPTPLNGRLVIDDDNTP